MNLLKWQRPYLVIDVTSGFKLLLLLFLLQELMNQQHSLGEIDTTIKPSHGNNNVI